MKIFPLENVCITVTRHGNNDYSIFFDNEDFSVRGTSLDVIKSFAEWQCNLDNPLVSFDCEETDQTITNPWADSSGRFTLTDSEACEKYGIMNLVRFIVYAGRLLNLDE